MFMVTAAVIGAIQLAVRLTGGSNSKGGPIDARKSGYPIPSITCAYLKTNVRQNSSNINSSNLSLTPTAGFFFFFFF